MGVDGLVEKRNGSRGSSSVKVGVKAALCGTIDKCLPGMLFCNRETRPATSTLFSGCPFFPARKALTVAMLSAGVPT